MRGRGQDVSSKIPHSALRSRAWMCSCLTQQVSPLAPPIRTPVAPRGPLCEWLSSRRNSIWNAEDNILLLPLKSSASDYVSTSHKRNPCLLATDFPQQKKLPPWDLPKVVICARTRTPTYSNSSPCCRLSTSLPGSGNTLICPFSASSLTVVRAKIFYSLVPRSFFKSHRLLCA